MANEPYSKGAIRKLEMRVALQRASERVREVIDTGAADVTIKTSIGGVLVTILVTHPDVLGGEQPHPWLAVHTAGRKTTAKPSARIGRSSGGFSLHSSCITCLYVRHHLDSLIFNDVD